MPISEAPAWITEFLEKKAPWWLECPLEVVTVYEDRKIAQVKKDGHLYTLVPERYAIY
jgi:hypothetical protein